MASKVAVRAVNNYDADLVSDLSGVDCSVEPSLTKQSFREEVDINVLVKRFGLDGQLPAMPVPMPTHEDFVDIFDFQSAMNAVVLAQRSFAAMPARVRARFENDPHKFVEFCSDKANLAEARELGLVPPEEIAPAAPTAAPAPAPAPSSEPAK